MLPNGFVCVCTDRLALIRQQREEAAKKREEEKAGNKPLTMLFWFQETELFPVVSDFSMSLFIVAKDAKKVDARK